MKNIFLACIALTFLAACGQQNQNNSKSDFKPESTKQKWSYSVGHQLGNELAGDQRDYDMDAMLAGIKDAWAKAPSAMSEEEMQAVIKEQMAKERDKRRESKKEKWEARNKLGEFYKLHAQQFLDKHAQKEGVKISESGLHYKHIVEGTGKSPKKGDNIEVQIRGTFLDGKEFENTYTRTPVHVKVGTNSKGLDEALMMMKEGGKAEFVIPAELAYGEEGAGLTIPPNAILVYEIELLKVQ